MSGIATIVTILFLAVIAPLMIVLHFVTKWKQSRELSSDDEQMLEDLWLHSQKLDDRLETLEKILDEEMSDWRDKL